MYWEVVMLVVTGMFENERFIPDTPISIPQRKKVTITIGENPTAETGQLNSWREIGEAILNCDDLKVVNWLLAQSPEI